MVESPQPVADRSWAWMVGFPVAFGGFLGWLGGTLWWRAAGPGGPCGSDRPGSDCLGVAFFMLPVALLLGLAVSWAVMAWAINAWVAPTMTFGGSLAAAYLVAAYQDVVGGPGLASPWVTAAAWGVGYGAVGVACLPGLRRGVRVPIVVILLAVPIGYVVVKSAA